MRRAGILPFARQAVPKAPARLAKIFAVCSICCALADCGIGNNSCVSFVWNPGGIDTPGNPSCPFTQGNGGVSVQINSSFASPAGPTSPNLQHVYVTLTGIEARTSAMPGQSSPQWQELAPDLAANPRQVDLLENGGEACASRPIARSEIPGGVYTEIRLRLAADDTPADDPSGDGAGTDANACVGVGRNCVFTTRGEMRPLIFAGAAPDLIIESKEMDGGFFRVLPDQENHLSIEFNPYASLAIAVGDAVKIIPQFTASTGGACESTSATQPQGASN